MKVIYVTEIRFQKLSIQNYIVNCRDSLVGITTNYGLDCPGIKSR
jgi:hypothetical protein